ncbi:MAG: glycerate kinase type-2 family protein [Nitrosotalea sp.]
MIIRNFQPISVNSAKEDALSIIDAGLGAADPRLYLQKIIANDHLVMPGRKIDLAKYDRVFLIAIGKASGAMVNAVHSLTHIDGGILVASSKVKISNKKFKIIQAGHPLPNKNSLVAAKMIIQFLGKTDPSDLVMFLISGGSSSLVAMPDGITLEEKQATTDLLLKCGASIQEINCIRKHLSKIKGGKMLEHLRSDAISLVMSDVVGNDLSSIASGMTYYDKTTFADAQKILKKYHLEKLVPKNVLQHLSLGVKGKIPETPKKAKIKNHIIATNKDCLDAMKLRAKDLGYSTKILGCLSGNVQDLGPKISKTFSGKKMSCIIFGGESTVVVTGKGKGGRNQELVLYAASDLSKKYKDVTVSSVGTDGIDGTTDCAGAIYPSDQKLDTIKQYLDKNNSYNFFKKYGGLIFTGPTGTNLMDIGLVLRK